MDNVQESALKKLCKYSRKRQGWKESVRVSLERESERVRERERERER